MDSYLDYLLPHDLPVTQDRPFTYAEALDALGSRRAITGLLERGLLVSDLRDTYRLASLADSHATRLATLRLVVPTDAVVCDRSAAWLHGADMALPPGAHRAAPAVDVFIPRNARLQNALVRSGARTLAEQDVVQLDGVRTTTPLRTACDVGRLLPREQAFAVMDGLAARGLVTPRDICASAFRFRGFRGVRQLRDLAPRVDGLAQSPPESILKLRWQDCTDLPRPLPQVAIETPGGTRYVDLGVPGIKYGAEYFGAAVHGPEQAEHDRQRLSWFREDGWVIDVLRQQNLFGVGQDWEHILRRGIARAQQRHGRAA